MGKETVCIIPEEGTEEVRADKKEMKREAK